MDHTSSIFTNDELTAILLSHSIVAANSSDLSNADFYDAWKDVVEILLMDAQRRFKWSTIGGHDVDQRFVYRNLSDLRDRLDHWEVGDIFAGGGMESWAIQQEKFNSDLFPGP
jgi:hypothetical protein